MFIDLNNDSTLPQYSIDILKDRYMLPEESSPQEAFARAAKAFSDNDEHAQRLYNYVSKFWFMFSTPLLSNGGTSRGLPISCFLSHVPDSRQGIADHYKENMFLASVGGGIGSDWSSLRTAGTSTSSGSQSNGVIPFIKVVDSEIMAVSQGKTRRGSYAYYLRIDHPDIEEAITARKPTGGDSNRKCLNLHNAVIVTDSFYNAVHKDLDWDLIDPHSKKVVKTVKARDLWKLIIETRLTTGEPYILNIDTANKCISKYHKALGLTLTTSNLCSEILEPVSEERTAVCCLSSVNLEKYDEWKDDPQFIEDLVRMLDNALEHFITHAPKELEKAIYSASRERSIGLGAMGFHSYLQSKNIPFEGPLASGINRSLFKHIKTKAEEATVLLAKERGSCPDAGTDVRRNIYLLAIAPNASSGLLAGTSPSIEPWRANAFTQKTLSGSFLVKNKYLQKLLADRGADTKEVWKSIITNEGSVQHLDILDDWEKDVFKTAMEIDQKWIVDHAAIRQEYICQSQSINLFFPSDVDIKYVHDVHWMAWVRGLKTLYYCRSTPVRRISAISNKVDRVQRQDSDECFSCEG